MTLAIRTAGVPEGFARETIVLPFNDLGAVQDVFDTFGDDIAGIILEPYPANVGLIFPKDGYLQGLRVCARKRIGPHIRRSHDGIPRIRRRRSNEGGNHS